MREMGLNAKEFNRLVDESGIKEKVKIREEGERITGKKAGKLFLRLPATKKVEEKKEKGKEKETQEIEMVASSPTVGSPMAISPQFQQVPGVSPEWTSPNPASRVGSMDPAVDWAVTEAMEKAELVKRVEVAEENERNMRRERDRLVEMLDGKSAFLEGFFEVNGVFYR